jgi:hypothetical protein
MIIRRRSYHAPPPFDCLRRLWRSGNTPPTPTDPRHACLRDLWSPKVVHIKISDVSRREPARPRMRMCFGEGEQLTAGR